MIKQMNSSPFLCVFLKFIGPFLRENVQILNKNRIFPLIEMVFIKFWLKKYFWLSITVNIYHEHLERVVM